MSRVLRLLLGATALLCSVTQSAVAAEQDNVFGDAVSSSPPVSSLAEAAEGNDTGDEIDFIEIEPVEDGRVRMVITFEDILPDEIESLLEIAGIDARIVLTIPEELAEVVMMTFEFARLVAKLPFVKYVEEDPKLFLIPTQVDARPATELSGDGDGDGDGGRRGMMRGLQGNNLDYDSLYGLNLVHAYDVSDQYISNRVICVIDSGCDRYHEDLSANTITGDKVGDVGNWFTDGNGHGTHVAGTIAAVNNGKGLQGVIRNGQAKIHCVKIFGDSGETYASEAVYELQRCKAKGAHVVNMSYGRTETSSTWGSSNGPTAFERRAYDRAYDDGMLLAAAAGNDGNAKPTWPAGYASVMSVGSVGQSKKRSAFSQYNDATEIVAPGDYIMSTFPSDKYAYLSGTSMATPHVAGVAALVWSHFPGKSAREVREALVESAEDLDAPGRDRYTGYGLVRADLAYNYLEARSDGSAPGNGGPGSGGDNTDGGNTDGGNPGNGGGKTQMCQTDPSFWVDSGGDGCEWYSSGLLCSTFGRFYKNYDRTAQTACCNCGGGKMVLADVTPVEDTAPVDDPQDLPPPTSPEDLTVTAGQCVDVPGWTDSYGDGCDWYANGPSEEHRCAEFGLCCGNEGDFGGLTASEACCACRGVMMSANAVGRTDKNITTTPEMVAVSDDPNDDSVPPGGDGDDGEEKAANEEDASATSTTPPPEPTTTTETTPSSDGEGQVRSGSAAVSSSVRLAVAFGAVSMCASFITLVG